MLGDISPHKLASSTSLVFGAHKLQKENRLRGGARAHLADASKQKINVNRP